MCKFNGALSEQQIEYLNIETQEGKKLAAHIVFHNAPENGKNDLVRIHHQLLENLPDYMVPDFYKIRSSMPVHNNGKRDIRALRDDREDLIPADSLTL